MFLLGFFSYFRERPRKPIARACQRKEGKARREGSGVKFVDFRFKRKQGVRIQGATRGKSFKSLQTLGMKDELWAEFVNLVKRVFFGTSWVGLMSVTVSVKDRWVSTITPTRKSLERLFRLELLMKRMAFDCFKESNGFA